MLTSQLLALDV
ncbi:hypothetical protein HND97_16635 [Vibrio cholerae]|nr:hypothetical protein HND97_16635 [Vibrio cholerae]